MDCNSYSYTAPGFEVDYNPPINQYRNDDMSADITSQGYGNNIIYWVWAGSYDGDLEVSECFKTLNVAQKLFNHIVTNYKDTPPDYRRLNPYIRRLHKMEA